MFSPAGRFRTTEIRQGEEILLPISSMRFNSIIAYSGTPAYAYESMQSLIFYEGKRSCRIPAASVRAPVPLLTELRLHEEVVQNG